MNYTEEIKKRMIPPEMLVQAEQLFLQYTVKNMGAQGEPLDLLRLAENKEVLAQAQIFQLAVKVLLKTLPEDMELLKELNKFMEEMDRCKSTLSACMNSTRGKIAKMR